MVLALPHPDAPTRVAERRRMVLNCREHRPMWSIPDASVEAIRGALPRGWELDVVEEPVDGRGDGGADSAGSRAALRAVQGAEVYVGFGVPQPLFRAATEGPGARLRWAHTAAAGVGGSLHAALRASRVVLTNGAGIYAEPIADTVLAMMLHFARGLDFAVRAQAARRWWKEPWEGADSPVRELADCTLGIVGLGGIGRAVARRGHALGMRVLATRRSGTEGPEGVQVLAGADALERLLPRADYLVLAAPLTDATRGMIGEGELAALPAGAVLVNVGRGEVVDEEALVRALASGRLRGAGLDVFAREPLPPSSPLWSLPNVLVTPHVSGTSHRFWHRQTELILDNLRRYLAGEPLRNTVDTEAGY
jgi:phosphoglycerate dehydrogenase-like enzyme